MLHYYHIPIFKCHVGTNQNLMYLLPHQQRARVKAKWFQPRVHRQWVIMSHYQVLVNICLPTPRRSHIRPIRLLLIQRARVKVKAKRIWIPPLILRRPLVNLFLPTPRPDHLHPIRLFLIQRARVKVKVNWIPPLITRPYLRPMIKGQRQSKKYNFRCRCQKEDEKAGKIYSPFVFWHVSHHTQIFSTLKVWSHQIHWREMNGGGFHSLHFSIFRVKSPKPWVNCWFVPRGTNLRRSFKLEGFLRIKIASNNSLILESTYQTCFCLVNI